MKRSKRRAAWTLVGRCGGAEYTGEALSTPQAGAQHRFPRPPGACLLGNGGRSRRCARQGRWMTSLVTGMLGELDRIRDELIEQWRHVSAEDLARSWVWRDRPTELRMAVARLLECEQAT